MSGYSHEMSFQDFVSTFYDLVLLAGKCAITNDFLQARCERDWQTAAIYLLRFIHITKEILNNMGVEVPNVMCEVENKELVLEETVVFSDRKVFIKQAMYDHLQQLSYRIRIINIVKIQRHVRVKCFQRKNAPSTLKALSLTSSSLAFFANVKFSKILKETNARIVIQRFIRTALLYLRARRRLYLIVKVQARCRGNLVRQGLRKRTEYAVQLVQCRWKRFVHRNKFMRKWAAVKMIQKYWRMIKTKLELRRQEKIVISIQRRWRWQRTVRKEIKRLESVQLNDPAKQGAVKKEFLDTLDERLAKDPLYLINLLQREEEVNRLSRRVDEMKKLAINRSNDVASLSSKLEQSVSEANALRATVNSMKAKDTAVANSGKNEVLNSIKQLQNWVAEKEKTRLRSLQELANTDSKLTGMTFDATLLQQKISDTTALLASKTEAFREFEFSLVKTSQNARQVEYDLETKKFELKSLQDECEKLQATSTKEMKQHESLKAFSALLQGRIQANSPEIQMAEMQFALGALRNGVTKLFDKDNSKERLQAVQNEANLAKAQKRTRRQSVQEENKPRVMADSPFNPNISFRNFRVQESMKQLGTDVLPKYTSFQQASDAVVNEAKGRRKSKVKNLSPPADNSGHKWKSKYLSKPTWCMICKQFIKGLTANQQHAFKCRICKVVGHRDCCNDFKCRCETLVFDSELDMLVPGDVNEHLWVSQEANVENKCDLCEKYISDTVPGKFPFECRRCKVYGHRDCCAKFTSEVCGKKMVSKKNDTSTKASAKIGEIIQQGTGQLGALVSALSTPTLEINSHKFKTKFLSKPTWCAYCKQFIVGLTAKQQNAVKCSLCKESCHRNCAISYNEGNEAKKHVCPQKPVK